MIITQIPCFKVNQGKECFYYGKCLGCGLIGTKESSLISSFKIGTYETVRGSLLHSAHRLPQHTLMATVVSRQRTKWRERTEQWPLNNRNLLLNQWNGHVSCMSMTTKLEIFGGLARLVRIIVASIYRAFIMCYIPF